jgi:CBS domain-containing protein
MKFPSSVVRMPVRIRRTLIAGDTSRRSLLVYCVPKRCSRNIEHCQECERCEGLSMDPDGIKHVLCNIEQPLPRRPQKIMPTAAEVTAIGSVMSREVVCVDASLARAEAQALFLARGLGGAAVVDGDGRPLGMLTRADLLAAQATHPPGAPVAELMTAIAYTLDENDALSRAAALMATEGVSHLPVVGDYGRVVGMVTTLDVTRWLARQSGYDV